MSLLANTLEDAKNKKSNANNKIFRFILDPDFILLFTTIFSKKNFLYTDFRDFGDFLNIFLLFSTYFKEKIIALGDPPMTNSHQRFSALGKTALYHQN